MISDAVFESFNSIVQQLSEDPDSFSDLHVVAKAIGWSEKEIEELFPEILEMDNEVEG